MVPLQLPVTDNGTVPVPHLLPFTAVNTAGAAVTFTVAEPALGQTVEVALYVALAVGETVMEPVLFWENPPVPVQL